MPLRGPEAGVIHIQYDFHCSAVKRIDSCLFLQSQIIFFFCETRNYLVISIPISFRRRNPGVQGALYRISTG